MAAVNSQKLKFRVISCSGEDPEYPVTELLTQSPQSKGWQSPRFCDYPQEITIQFFAPVRVRQVQFLSHQSKIPSKIELYCYLPQMATPLPNTEFKYKKLGYLSLDSNERSGFQARELKSVYIDAPCQYMKYVLHKCHINKYNLFNQVGIIALSVFGGLLGSSSGNPAGQIGGAEVKPNHAFEKLEYEMQFDPTTLDRLKTLQAAKDRAVKMEEFEEAKRLKEAIERLKQIGIQLQHLEERKNIAISNEDYDSAKIIKAEIDRLRNAVAPDSLLNPLTNMHGGMAAGNPGDLPPVHHSSHRPWSGNEKALPAQPAGRPESKYNRQAEEAKLPPPNELNMPEGEPIVHEKPAPRKVQNVERATRKEQIQPYDDQPLPTAQKKEQMDENGGLGGLGGGRNDDDRGGEPSGEAEALTGENYKLAEPLIPILGENCCRKLFSKTWAMREEALKFIEKELKGGREIKQDDPGDLFIAVMGAVSHTINDKISQVSLASMQLLHSITGRPVPKFGSKTELNSYVDNILTVLTDKIGDNNKRVQEAAEKAIQSCTKNQAVGCNNVVMTLIRTQTGQKAKAASVKQVCARVHRLTDIIQQFNINNSNVPFTPVVEYACKQLENSSEEVRKATIAMLVEIYRIVGDGKLRPLLSGVRPAQMEIIQGEFDKVSGGGGGGRGKNVQDEPETVITTNINTQGANKTKTTTAKSPGQPSTKKTPGGGGAGGGKGTEEEKEPKGPRTRPNADQTKVCEFCGKADKKFLDSDALDLHLWRECPMLTTCQLCAQVVEIAELNHHLLEECDKKKTMKRCPRCKEAVASNEYKQHTEEMSCLVARPENAASRCPLCHQDIGPGTMGWKSHLISEGCPNNERTA